MLPKKHPRNIGRNGLAASYLIFLGMNPSGFFNKHYWKLILGSLALVVFLGCVTNPLRWPDSWLHAWLLHKVPVGSSQDYFLEVAKTEGWRSNGLPWKGHQMDLKMMGGFDPLVPVMQGELFYWVHLGTFYMVFREDVQAYWAFDAKGNFIDVQFRREIDAL